MLDAQMIAEMSGEEKRHYFDKFTAQAMPGYTIVAMAEKLGYERRQIQLWKTEPDKIRPIVLLLLQEWAINCSEQRAVQTLADISADFAGIAEKLARLSEELKP